MKTTFTPTPAANLSKWNVGDLVRMRKNAFRGGEPCEVVGHPRQRFVSVRFEDGSTFTFKDGQLSKR